MEKHIFEIKQMMNDKGWSNITPDEFNELDFFTRAYVLENIEDPDCFNPIVHDVVLGCGEMFWDLHTEQW